MRARCRHGAWSGGAPARVPSRRFSTCGPGYLEAGPASSTAEGVRHPTIAGAS
jgi:hypothetical protein